MRHLANAVLDVREVYEDTVYQVAHDVIAVHQGLCRGGQGHWRQG